MKTMRKLAMLILLAAFFFAANVNATETERKALIHESIEAELEIEDWMTNESVWNMEQSTAIAITEELESGLEIENWMVNEEFWEIDILTNEKEKELFVECWMISENLWNR